MRNKLTAIICGLFRILFIFLYNFYLLVSADCTFDSSLVGSWTSNVYDTITVSSSVLTLGSHTFNINGKTTTDWTCHDNSTEPYVILRYLYTFI